MANNKTRAIQIKVTPEEYDKIKQNADNIGLSISSYVRLVSINSKVEIGLRKEN